MASMSFLCSSTKDMALKRHLPLLLFSSKHGGMTTYEDSCGRKTHIGVFHNQKEGPGSVVAVKIECRDVEDAELYSTVLGYVDAEKLVRHVKGSKSVTVHFEFDNARVEEKLEAIIKALDMFAYTV